MSQTAEVMRNTAAATLNAMLDHVIELVEKAETGILDAGEELLSLQSRPDLAGSALNRMSAKIGHLRVRDRVASRAREELVKALENFSHTVKKPAWVLRKPVWKRVFSVDCLTIVEKVRKVMVYCEPVEISILTAAVSAGLGQKFQMGEKDINIGSKDKKDEKKKEENMNNSKSVLDD